MCPISEPEIKSLLSINYNHTVAILVCICVWNVCFVLLLAMVCCVLKLQASLKWWVNIILLSTSADVWVGWVCVCVWWSLYWSLWWVVVVFVLYWAVCVCLHMHPQGLSLSVSCALSWPLSESIRDLITSARTHKSSTGLEQRNKHLNTLATMSFSEQEESLDWKRSVKFKAANSLGIWLVRR